MTGPRIMHLDVGDAPEEPILKRIPPALIRHLITETVGPVEYPRPATPSVDFLEFTDTEE